MSVIGTNNGEMRLKPVSVPERFRQSLMSTGIPKLNRATEPHPIGKSPLGMQKTLSPSSSSSSFASSSSSSTSTEKVSFETTMTTTRSSIPSKHTVSRSWAISRNRLSSLFCGSFSTTAASPPTANPLSAHRRRVSFSGAPVRTPTSRTTTRTQKQPAFTVFGNIVPSGNIQTVIMKAAIKDHQVLNLGNKNYGFGSVINRYD